MLARPRSPSHRTSKMVLTSCNGSCTARMTAMETRTRFYRCAHLSAYPVTHLSLCVATATAQMFEFPAVQSWQTSRKVNATLPGRAAIVLSATSRMSTTFERTIWSWASVSTGSSTPLARRLHISPVIDYILIDLLVTPTTTTLLASSRMTEVKSATLQLSEQVLQQK